MRRLRQRGIVRRGGVRLKIWMATTLCFLEKTAHLWRISWRPRRSGFGLKVASQIKHTTFHALGYGLSASSTLKRPSLRLQRYCHVVTMPWSTNLQVGGDYHFIIEPVTLVPGSPSTRWWARIYACCRSLIGRDYSPLSIELRARGRTSWRTSIGCCVRRCASKPSKPLIFDGHSIERRSTAGNRNSPAQ